MTCDACFQSSVPMRTIQCQIGSFGSDPCPGQQGICQCRTPCYPICHRVGVDKQTNDYRDDPSDPSAADRRYCYYSIKNLYAKDGAYGPEYCNGGQVSKTYNNFGWVYCTADTTDYSCHDGGQCANTPVCDTCKDATCKVPSPAPLPSNTTIACTQDTYIRWKTWCCNTKTGDIMSGPQTAHNYACESTGPWCTADTYMSANMCCSSAGAIVRGQQHDGDYGCLHNTVAIPSPRPNRPSTHTISTSPSRSSAVPNPPLNTHMTPSPAPNLGRACTTKFTLPAGTCCNRNGHIVRGQQTQFDFGCIPNYVGLSCSATGGMSVTGFIDPKSHLCCCAKTDTIQKYNTVSNDGKLKRRWGKVYYCQTVACAVPFPAVVVTSGPFALRGYYMIDPGFHNDFRYKQLGGTATLSWLKKVQLTENLGTTSRPQVFKIPPLVWVLTGYKYTLLKAGPGVYRTLLVGRTKDPQLPAGTKWKGWHRSHRLTGSHNRISMEISMSCRDTPKTPPVVNKPPTTSPTHAPCWGFSNLNTASGYCKRMATLKTCFTYLVARTCQYDCCMVRTRQQL